LLSGNDFSGYFGRSFWPVKAGRRPPPQAAQCGLEGREHSATLNQVGSEHVRSAETTRHRFYRRGLAQRQLPEIKLETPESEAEDDFCGVVHTA